MDNYSVYVVEEPHEVDFYNEIEPRRLKLFGKHYFENGKEVAVEAYNGDELLSRTVSTFNDEGHEVQTLEYTGNETLPFKVVTREFNEMGLVTVTRRNYGDDEPEVDYNIYDDRGRLLQATVMGDDGEARTEYYTYMGDCPLPSTHISDWDKQNAHETRYVHIKVKGEYKVSEEYFTHRFDKHLSRVTKYYWNDELPNNVFEQVFNSEGELLEEMREVETGNTVRHSWHLNSLEDCAPYKFTLITEDKLNRITREEHFENGIRFAVSIWQNDKSGRVVRRYSGLAPDASLLIYKYEN